MSDRIVSTKPATASPGDLGQKNGSVNALNLLNFFLADVQTGIGPFLVVYLSAQQHWKPGMIGLAMGISGVVGVLAQIPAGAIIDATRHKRSIIAAACAAIALASLAIGYLPNFGVITGAQSFIAMAGAVFGPAIAAITLGLVGRQRLDRQVGRNQTYNSAGNVVNAIALGLCGYYAGKHGIFWLVALLAVAAIFCVFRIRQTDIDYDAARGSDREVGDITPDGHPGPETRPDSDHVTPVTHLFTDRRLLVFAISAILFHFANGGLGPLVTQVVVKQVGDRAMLYQSAMTIVSQLVVTGLGWWVGGRASMALRKPIFLIAFAMLPIRAGLYILTKDANHYVALQILDGVSGGIFGIMQLLVIADLTKGTGRFNLSQGALATAVGIGASLSNIVGGYLVRAAGFNAGFATMAAVAVIAFFFFWRLMPETKVSTKAQDGDPGSYPFLA